MKNILLSLLFLTSSVYAAPVTLDFVFTDTTTNAQTTGYIVLETDLIDNPGFNEISLPSPAVLDLQLTVTGSAFSDGDYSISDYDLVLFGTNGATLNFNQALIGQATDGSPWGTTFDGESGEFNFISFAQGPPGPPGEANMGDFYNEFSPSGVIGDPPSGCWYFTLCENINQDGTAANGGIQGGPSPAVMELQSFQPQTPQGAPASVPTLSFWAMTLMIFGLFTVVFLKRKQQA
ncbi:hypothetical protein [Marinicella litoralis]|uniref:Secreted protein (IPTL-CTERM system target) n=1 Tax=Marinicella litoralis TaxID=644220 RepID=A0A4R6XVI2_9GAMM|nr:hypothetical protein [Marinicella litoralis]TDR22410.1 hypothetical protein C8D91_0898 [Marinicella litoralis]